MHSHICMYPPNVPTIVAPITGVASANLKTRASAEAPKATPKLTVTMATESIGLVLCARCSNLKSPSQFETTGAAQEARYCSDCRKPSNEAEQSAEAAVPVSPLKPDHSCGEHVNDFYSQTSTGRRRLHESGDPLLVPTPPNSFFCGQCHTWKDLSGFISKQNKQLLTCFRCRQRAKEHYAANVRYSLNIIIDTPSLTSSSESQTAT